MEKLARVIARKKFRIGVQMLLLTFDGRYILTISNRTYKSSAEVPPERIGFWLRELSD